VPVPRWPGRQRKGAAGRLSLEPIGPFASMSLFRRERILDVVGRSVQSAGAWLNESRNCLPPPESAPGAASRRGWLPGG
jgi:hypothetical protein